MTRSPTPGIDHRLALGSFIANRGQSRRLDAGEPLFHEGDRSTAVFACTKGRINLAVTSPNGREVILGTKTPVEGFGELSAICEAARTASAYAMERSTVHTLPGPDFLAELECEPTLASAVLRELAAHLVRSNNRLSARSVETSNERVAKLLVELGAKFERHGRASSIVLPITQDEVGAWVGATREAAARSLAVLRRSGAIETGRGRITIVDAELLETLAAGTPD